MTRVGIIGSGFGGLSVAAELLRHGHRPEDLVVWERAEDSGGVWRDNTYPGAGCDAPSPLYSFSWAQDVRWSRRYARQPEILAYLRTLSDRLGVTARTRFGHEVLAAAWTGEAWEVDLAGRPSETVDVLVPAVGQLSQPLLPALPGLDRFRGPWFHSARWDDEADLSGRVAVVGTGASAVQFVPHLADRARQVTVFQRTPNWVLPKPDADFTARWRRPLLRLERPAWHRITETLSPALDEGTRTADLVRAAALRHLRHQVADPGLRDALTPSYPLGCKRVLFSNDWFPALTRDHVALVTDGVEEVTERGVVAGGEEHEVDAIVFGTGFDSQSFLDTITVTGRDGLKLADQWRDGARAYLGIHVPGFPNLLLSYGPNTNLGGSSILVMLEAQARHVRATLEHLAATGARSVEVTREADQEWDAGLQQRLARSAWASCDSWYRDPQSGRITSNWPGRTATYEHATDTLRPEAFTWR